MIVEVLYPELTNIYGDLANARYLAKCMKAQLIETSFNEEPTFLKKKVDVIYFGSMPDDYQEKIVEKLKKYKEKINELIKNNTVFLVTGTALEIFGKYVVENGKKMETLGIFDMYFERNKDQRHNSLFLGTFDNLKIVGNQSRFTRMFSKEKPLFEACEGCFGMNNKTNKEGVHSHNFMGTYVLGPLLILNPDFTKYILKLVNVNNKLEFETELKEAYKKRLKSLERKDVRYLLGDHG